MVRPSPLPLSRRERGPTVAGFIGATGASAVSRKFIDQIRSPRVPCAARHSRRTGFQLFSGLRRHHTSSSQRRYCRRSRRTAAWAAGSPRGAPARACTAPSPRRWRRPFRRAPRAAAGRASRPLGTGARRAGRAGAAGLRRWADRAIDETSSAVGADVMQQVFHTVRAKRTFITADARLCRVRGQVAGAHLAIGSQFQHQSLP